MKELPPMADLRRQLYLTQWGFGIAFILVIFIDWSVKDDYAKFHKFQEEHPYPVVIDTTCFVNRNEVMKACLVGGKT